MNTPDDRKNALAAGALTSLVASTSIALAWYFASFGLLVLVVGLTSALILGLVVYLSVACQRRQFSGSSILDSLFKLAKDDDVADFHKKVTKFLSDASERRDTIFRELLNDRLKILASEVESLGNGRIEFVSTESWRIFYEQILRSPGISLYRSVAHVETQSYWQDSAGRKSTELNLELHDSGKVSMERIAIIADHLWRPDELFPVSIIHEWLEEQYRFGIWISLVRESELTNEKELISDFGIYGNRAVGRQSADVGGRTIRFTLSFDNQDIEKANEIWKKLGVFAVPYSDLLDRQH